MKLIKIFLPLALLPFALAGQNLKSLDLLVSPEFFYRTLSPKSDPVAISRNHDEVPGLGFRVGVGFQIFNLSERLAFRTGLNFARSHYRMDDREKTALPAKNTLEIPLMLRFYGGERKCATYFDIGGGLHRRFADGVEPKGATLLSANTGFGFVWLFSKNLSWYGQPALRYFLSAVESGDGLREHWFSAGFETGVRMYFQ